MSKYIELAKKLYELAKRGEGGEKDNAEKMLRRFMMDHSITLEDLEEDVKKRREFKVMDVQDTFFQQILYHVTGSSTYRYNPRQKYSVKKTKWVDLSDSQYAEVKLKFEFYWLAYEKDLKIFYAAFIQKNKLFGEGKGDAKELTPEERRRNEEILNMADSLKRHNLVKQIEK
ncbi:MAG: hypothetical protein H7X88_01775 [Gloeobacteraceae cyanobacterium ES-bin-316]|nr:hypothetical protein [Ferruginibacter sp.]